MFAGLPTVLAQVNQRTYFEWVRLRALDQWWHWMLLVAIVLAIGGWVVWLYRRDGVELPRATTATLALLRLTAFAGLLLFFLQLEKRSEQRQVKPSRLAVLVDTSQSMSLSDTQSESTAAPPTRLEQVAEAFDKSPLLSELQAEHEVSVYRFDQDELPETLGVLPYQGDRDTLLSTDMSREERANRSLSEARSLYRVAAVLLGLAVLSVCVHLLLGFATRSTTGESWALLVSVLFLIVGLVFGAVSHLRNPDIGWAQLWGQAPVVLADDDGAGGQAEESQPDTPTIDWSRTLQLRGAQTRLGDAIKVIVDKERGGPMAGIVVFSDGNQNAGRDVNEVANRARDAEIPVFAVGLGSDRRPQNIRLADVEAPPRVFPGDAFNLTAYLQAFGLEGRSARLSLFARPAEAQSDNPAEAAEDLGIPLEERQIRLAADGQMISEVFQLTPEEAGKYVYSVRVTSDEREVDAEDNQGRVSVKFVDRRTRVLLLAGGPTREFRFVRNQYFRDPQIELDVLLQSSPGVAAQEADRVLDEFPETTEELFEYDAMIAFDPDWEQLSVPQLETIERWVAENAGGLLLVAGNVHLPEWSGERRSTAAHDILRGLFPVTFYSQSAQRLSRGRAAAEEPWPLEFTQEGDAAGFLWLGDDREASQKAWLRFPGVFAYFPVPGVKPGATVYARFSNPETTLEDQLPVYVAGHFYGAGRVLYLGSGEFWRLRAIDPAYFEQFYTKTLRYITEGRLLRDSSRGLLLVEKDRCTIGEVVPVRAVLQDAQHRPLTDDEVSATLVDPRNNRTPLVLKAIQDASQAGTFTGQFIAKEEGNYRVEMVVPGGDTLDYLEREVQVRVPELEVENPRRNDRVLGDLARVTGGQYYVGLPAALGDQQSAALTRSIAPKSQTTYLPSIPDNRFDRHWMTWLLAMICGALSLEWLIRRINRLA